MSGGDNVWQLLAESATVLDGDRETSGRAIDQRETDLRSIPRQARDETRRQMIQIVATLSRLEVWLIETDRPLPATV